MACCYAVQDKVWVDGRTASRGRSTRCWPTWRCPPASSAQLTPRRARSCCAGREPASVGSLLLSREPRWAAESSPRPWALGCSSPPSLAPASPPSGCRRATPGSSSSRTRPPRRAALVAIILAVGPVSGAHLNPVVTWPTVCFGGLTSLEAGAYVAGQVAGGVAGAVIANLMFVAARGRAVHHAPASSGGLWLGEVVATFGLLLVVFGVARSGRPSVAPFAVGAYIGGCLLLHVVHDVRQPGRHRSPGR